MINMETLAAAPSTNGRAACSPFDLAALRVDHAADPAAGLGIERALAVVPVRKPAKDAWVRVHPDPAYRLDVGVVELESEGETYLVPRALHGALQGEAAFRYIALFTAVTRQGTLFLWPVKMAGPDGAGNTWNESALAAAAEARGSWVRVSANMEARAYDVRRAAGPHLGEPRWPDAPFEELLAIAFKGRLIDSLDHPVLQRLRGEA